MIKTDENGKELKLFKIGDLFSIFPTKAYKISDSEIIGEEGEYYPTPFITTTESNNGVKGISGLKPNNPGNVITFSDTTGTDSIFYQSKPYIGRSHVQEMQIKNGKFDRKIALYVISSIKKSVKGVYSYGFKMNRQRVSATEIYLPIDHNGDPDWDYMSDYISNVECDYVDSVKSFNDRELRILDSIYADTESPGEPYEYKEFTVGDVFDLISIKQVPRGYNPGDYYGGNIPYITQTKDNNGVTGFMVEESGLKLNDSNCIIIGVDNVANGVVYYQPTEFFANKVYGIKHDSMNSKSAMFIITLLKKTYIGKYSYSNKISKSIIEETKLMLPITIDGSIDWDYMEKYISNIAGGGRRRIDKWITSRNKEY